MTQVTPSSLLPRRRQPEVAVGTVVSVGAGAVSVRLRQDLTITLPAQGAYAVGQMVSVAMPGGSIASAQVLGGVAGNGERARQMQV